VPRPKDEPETNTLPDPEQNPLLNPLLAAHMGRWAEVYFTNPPEKRGEAIAELIRELENAAPPAEPSPPAVEEENAKERNESEEHARIAEAQQDAQPMETFRICSVCAYENAVGQNFCGMCGASLQRLPETLAPEIVEAVAGARDGESESSDSLGGHLLEYSSAPAFSPTAAAREPDYRMENEVPSFGIAAEPGAYRYRPYVGVVLAILLVLLVYMAWRGTKAISGKAGLQSAPESAPAQVVPPAPAPVDPAPVNEVQPPSTMPGGSSGDNAAASANPEKNQSEETPGKNQTVRVQPASREVSITPTSSAGAGEPNGAEDLATAQKYLSGTQGMTRDSREAALWLWKAVGKGNPAATIALSDLYLRGDGVTKSCDQARLLLDAAARKGARAAAERLRNLPAFGCQ
jgi:hypothetical protein